MNRVAGGAASRAHYFRDGDGALLAQEAPRRLQVAVAAPDRMSLPLQQLCEKEPVGSGPKTKIRMAWQKLYHRPMVEWVVEVWVRDARNLHLRRRPGAGAHVRALRCSSPSSKSGSECRTHRGNLPIAKLFFRACSSRDTTPEAHLWFARPQRNAERVGREIHARNSFVSLQRQNAHSMPLSIRPDCLNYGFYSMKLDRTKSKVQSQCDRLQPELRR